MFSEINFCVITEQGIKIENIAVHIFSQVMLFFGFFGSSMATKQRLLWPVEDSLGNDSRNLAQFWLFILFREKKFADDDVGRRRHHLHLMNLKTVGYHWAKCKESITQFWRRFCAKTWTKDSASNKLVLSTRIGVHEKKLHHQLTKM